MKTCLGGIYMSNESVRLHDFITIDIKTAQKLFSEYDKQDSSDKLKTNHRRIKY